MADVFYEPNQSVSFATKHKKERAVSRPMCVGLGFRVVIPEEIDTDAFGTFSGEIERPGKVREVLLQKAQLGMQITGLPRGIASEGSFAPHPLSPFIAADHELMIFIDDEKGFQIVEQIISTETNFAHLKASSFSELKEFLPRVGFPRHGVIVRPDNRHVSEFIFKGLQNNADLTAVFEKCRAASNDGIVHIETDMRAHLNPTRMKIVRKLAIKLVRRLKNLCPACGTPGFGFIVSEKGLPCGWCFSPTELVNAEIHGCAKCDYRQKIHPKSATADPQYCQVCNP